MYVRKPEKGYFKKGCTYGEKKNRMGERDIGRKSQTERKKRIFYSISLKYFFDKFTFSSYTG